MKKSVLITLAIFCSLNAFAGNADIGSAEIQKKAKEVTARQQLLSNCMAAALSIEEEGPALTPEEEEKQLDALDAIAEKKCPAPTFFYEDHPELSEAEVQIELTKEFIIDQTCKNEKQAAGFRLILASAGLLEKMTAKGQACEGL